MKTDANLTENGTPEAGKRLQKNTQKIGIFSRFFPSPTLPKSSSRVGVVTISEIGFRKALFSGVFFGAVFGQKIKFFRPDLARLTTSKHCFLQGNLSIFMFYRNFEA